MNNLIYFDNAATSYPKPSAVYDEVMRCMTEYCGNPGRSSHILSRMSAEMIYRCREKLAAHFHTNSPECVVFTENATHALNLAIKTLVKYGDHVLISNFEHNSVLRPIESLSAIGVTYDVFDASGCEEETVASISSLINERTRMIIATHRSNICGVELPIYSIGKLCLERGFEFIIDASQSVGTSDINFPETHASALCAPGHKGLLGPQGVGFALFSDKFSGEGGAMLDTLIEGGNGVSSLEAFMPDYLPERLEAGTPPTPAIAGLLRGLEFVCERSPIALFAHECMLCERMREMLENTRFVKIYGAGRAASSILLFNIEGIPCETAAEMLSERGICLRSGYHCSALGHRALGTDGEGALRISFGAFNTERELDLFYRELRSVIKETR